MQSQTSADQPVTGGAQSIRRAVEIIRAVAQFQRSGASLSRVSRATGLNTSTSFRILRSLCEERLLRYDDIDRCYFVGPLAFELGLAASASAEAHAQTRWRGAVDQVARETRLTTYLMARSGHEAICLCCVQGTMALRAMPVEVGQRLPLGIGAGSLAILASLGDVEIQRILVAEESKLDLFPGGRSEAEHILERVELTRQRGFSVSIGTVAPGVVGVGVAISPDNGLAHLALSVSAVARRINAADARDIASVISAAIQNHQS
jgi:DNA-binding IclR family transcriptional regulator